MGTFVAAAIVVARGGAPLAAQVPEAALPEALRLEVYATALAFYAPPRDQVRWIEATPLYASRGRTPFDHDFIQALVARLGARFLPGSTGERGRGGRLRLSAIHPLRSSGLYRLAIGYRHHTEDHEGPASAQTFVVGCDADGCRILQRAAVAGPADW